MILIDKEGVKWRTDGIFHTMTVDWNYDGDVYTDTVMRLWEVDGNRYNDIHEYDLDSYKTIERTGDTNVAMELGR